MIKLDLDYYCNECPFFEAQVVRGLCGDEHVTIVKCKDQLKCRELYKRFTAIDKAASQKPECDL